MVSTSAAGAVSRYDAVVVGAGPNALSAAIVLAQAGLSVVVLEAKETVGGGCRTAELTLPGFAHDICSAVHPLGISSPFFRGLPLTKCGLAWIHPPTPLAHPLDDGTAVALEKSLDETCAGLGPDANSYRKLMRPLVASWEGLVEDILKPPGIPRHPVSFARFGLNALRSAGGLAQSRFRGERARALFAGMAAHGVLPLDRAPTAAFGLTLAAAGHACGWPLAERGSQAIADALATHFRSLGGEIWLERPVDSVDDLPEARAVLFDVTPRQLLSMAGSRLPDGYARKLGHFRYGPGVFKVDWALREPIPWKAVACARAATVHVGGTLQEIDAAEQTVWRGEHPDRPYVLLVQASLFDRTRAPGDQHTAWAYCHVPSGSTFDMTERIENQVERFAPGFRECILARSVMPPKKLEEHNPNNVGGDISGGLPDLRQTFMRPVPRFRPYSIPVQGWYLCSSSAPPGGGVHGMCGFHAANMALRNLSGR